MGQELTFELGDAGSSRTRGRNPLIRNAIPRSESAISRRSRRGRERRGERGRRDGSRTPSVENFNRSEVYGAGEAQRIEQQEAHRLNESEDVTAEQSRNADAPREDIWDEGIADVCGLELAISESRMRSNIMIMLQRLDASMMTIMRDCYPDFNPATLPMYLPFDTDLPEVLN